MTDFQYLLWSHKHRAWWKTDGYGYSTDVALAGRFAYGAAVTYVGEAACAGRVDQGLTLIVAPEVWGEHAEIAAKRAAPTGGSPFVYDFAKGGYLALRCAHCGKVIDWQQSLNVTGPSTVEDLSVKTRIHAVECSANTALPPVRSLRVAATQ